jgi:hypothetical protein
MLEPIELTGSWEADFYWIIEVSGGVDNDGDSVWRYDCPDNCVDEGEGYDPEADPHSWNVGTRDKVTITIKLYDRDAGPGDWDDDHCDINVNRESRDAFLTYSLVAVDGVFNERFNGSSDGSNADDNEEDAILEVNIWDDFIPTLKIKLTAKDGTNFGDVKIYDSKTKTFYVENDGNSKVTFDVSLDGHLYFDILSGGGRNKVLDPGDKKHEIVVEFNPWSITGSKSTTLIVDGAYGANSESLTLTGNVVKSKSRSLDYQHHLLSNLLVRFRNLKLFKI